jgi:acyl-coenzyme A thioesterase PaaI-like protein
VSLCGENCLSRGECRLGITTELLDGDGVARFELECPPEHGEGFGLAHGGWTTSVLCEMAGHVAILSGTLAFMGTLTVRFAKPVPVREPLLGHASIDGRERRKVFVSAGIASSTSGHELATAAAVLIVAETAHLEIDQPDPREGPK